MQSEDLFVKDDEDIDEDVSPYGVEVAKSSKIEVFRSMLSQLKQIEKSYDKRRI